MQDILFLFQIYSNMLNISTMLLPINMMYSLKFKNNLKKKKTPEHLHGQGIWQNWADLYYSINAVFINF